MTEAASVGATIAFAFAVGRGKVMRQSFLSTLRETAGNTGLIYVIIMGLGLPPLMVIFLLIIMYLILGSVFDTVAAMASPCPSSSR